MQSRAVNVDLQTDATLQVDISDALSERDKVKFTVHTKVSVFTSCDEGTWMIFIVGPGERLRLPLVKQLTSCLARH